VIDDLDSIDPEDRYWYRRISQARQLGKPLYVGYAKVDGLLRYCKRQRDVPVAWPVVIREEED
jgi:hypothetical protein